MTAKHFGRFLFCVLHSTLLSGPDSVVLAWRAKPSDVTTGPVLSHQRLHSIRGGEIRQLQTIEETEALVAENSEHENQLVVLSFSSTDCPPCKKVAPLFVELSESEEFADKNIVFGKVNVDENPATATKYGVTGWPAFLFLKKGEKVMEIVGGKLAEATLYDWVKLMAPKDEETEPQEEISEVDAELANARMQMEIEEIVARAKAKEAAQIKEEEDDR